MCPKARARGAGAQGHEMSYVIMQVKEANFQTVLLADKKARENECTTARRNWEKYPALTSKFARVYY